MEEMKLKKITQEEFNSFEVIDGIKQCPTGDYSRISNFNIRCSFGEGCSFGEECIFENNKNIIGYYAIDRLGSRNAKCYFFYTAKKEIYVRTGCFYGTIEEFKTKVYETYKEGEKYRKEYELAIDFAVKFIGLK